MTIRCRAYHYAQRICTVYNFHAYTLRFRCLPRPWRARAWRARRLKKGRHWRRRRTPFRYLKQIPFWSACSAFQHGRLYRPYTARTQVAAHKVVSLCTGLAVLRSSLTRFDSQAHTRCRRATLRACHEYPRRESEFSTKTAGMEAGALACKRATIR